MIARSIDALVMLAGGFALGWLLTTELAPPVEPESDPVAAAPVLPANPAPAVTEVIAAAADCPDVVRPTVAPPPPPPPPPDRQPPLPDVYLDILGPVTSDAGRSTTALAYARFAREPRDESWANAMEAGIEAWSEGVAARSELRTDFAECRTRTCLIAGSAASGDTSELDFLPAEGWWQASTLDVIGRETRNDAVDFVIFVHR